MHTSLTQFARLRARQLAGSRGFSRDEEDDLFQEFALEYLRSMRRYDLSRASVQTFGRRSSHVCVEGEIRDRLHDGGIEIFVQSDDLRMITPRVSGFALIGLLERNLARRKPQAWRVRNGLTFALLGDCSHCRKRLTEKAMMKVILEFRYRSAARQRLRPGAAPTGEAVRGKFRETQRKREPL